MAGWTTSPGLGNGAPSRRDRRGCCRPSPRDGLRVAVQPVEGLGWPVEHQRGCLTVVQAAEWLGISRAKLYELLGGGELRSFTVGRARRIPMTELVGFVERRLSAGPIS
jgi:excisionase family DNA binding protein